MTDKVTAVAGPITAEELARLAVVYGEQNVVPIPLYSTVAVEHGNDETVIQFFTDIKGEVGVWNTNMEQANSLMSGKIQYVDAISLDPSFTALAKSVADDVIALTHGPGVFQFKIDGKVFAQDLIKALIGGGLFGFGDPTVAAATAGDKMPYVCPRFGGDIYRLTPGLVIPTNTEFTFELDYPSKVPVDPVNTIYLRTRLHGQLLRQATA